MTNIVGSPTKYNSPTGVNITGGFGTHSCNLDTVLNLTCYDSLKIIFTISKGNFSGSSSLNGIPASLSPTTYSYTTTNTSSLSFSVIINYFSINGTQNLLIKNLKIIGYQTISTCTAAPVQPTAVMGPTIVCAGATNVFFTPPICGATSYNWILPSGWTGTSTTNTIAVTTTTASGSLSVTANNVCGASSPQTLNISVNTFTPSVPGTVSGITPVCYGASTNYSVALVAGATSYSWAVPATWYISPSSTNTVYTIPVSSGNITVTASNFCFTSLPQTFSVTVFPQNNVSVTINPNPICAGQSVTLTMTCSKMKTYLWSPGPGGNPMVVTPTISTNYQATALDSNNCQTTLWVTPIVLTCTEINSLTLTNDEINFYPNPFNNKITIISNGRKNSIQIYNSLASLVYNAIIEDTKSEIDLSGLFNGIYFIRISNEKIISTKKVIKE
ncbi:MAG TPA: T9SS type A sorting domain-containing protein [Bacteroidia bacterium]|nr:T9SS type A sorting domain-containing protein [Bacteroidia bacterium]